MTWMVSPSARCNSSPRPSKICCGVQVAGDSGWRRTKASNCEDNFAPRSTAAMEALTRRCTLALPASCRANKCRLPAITCSRLLKS
ncbi:hypothetical protein D3C85_1497410 [compost metagenome]